MISRSEPRKLTVDERLALIRDTLAWMGPRYEGPEAELMLLAISLQEDAGCERCQRGGGPARGLWQMEPPTIDLLFRHDRSHAKFKDVVRDSGCSWADDVDLCEEFQSDDRLACAFARLLLWTDPHPLPPVPGSPFDAAAMDEAWECYRRLWRPGRPRPLDWPHSYRAALAEVSRTGPAVVS